MNKVLIVDDSRTTRYILSKIFKAHNYDVYQAESGPATFEMLRELNDFTVLCIDCNMPQMSGIEVTRQLRRMPPFRLTPILMITTETHPKILEAAMAAGVNEYVMKPFSTDIILDKLRILQCPVEGGND